jgi:hypothetical protein
MNVTSNGVLAFLTYTTLRLILICDKESMNVTSNEVLAFLTYTTLRLI